MRLKFWQRVPEKRESQPFTDAVLQAIVSQAEGTTPGDPAQTWALETSANLYARAFSAAKITGERTDKITPSMLALIARNLIRRGDSLHVIELRRGAVDFLPVGSWDVRGGWDEAGWFYRADLFGPSGNLTRLVQSGHVLHFRYAVDPARPWHGISPLGWARDTGTLQANLEKRLGEEAGAPTAHVLPIPQDGGDGGKDDPLAMLKADIAAAKGKNDPGGNDRCRVGRRDERRAESRLESLAAWCESAGRSSGLAIRIRHECSLRLRCSGEFGDGRGWNFTTRKLAALRHGRGRAATRDRGRGTRAKTRNHDLFRPHGIVGARFTGPRFGLPENGARRHGA